MDTARHPHLEPVDVDAWPGVAAVPSGPLMDLHARRAEARFAKACENAGVALSGDTPDLIIDREELFPRLAASGWLGLAESYMAGEWRTDSLGDVLTALIGAGYDPKARLPLRTRMSEGVDDGGALPTELVRISSGDGMSAFGGIFSSGVPTTVRTAVKSHVPGAGRGNEPGTHFVDITTFGEPLAVEREDLGEAQRRAVAMLLDAAKVTRSTHLLEWPSAGGAVAIMAARRNATVDTLTADAAQAAAVDELLTLAGVSDAVHTQVIDQAIPGPRDWQGTYDAIVSMEKLEVVGESGRKQAVAALDRLLVTGGMAAVQSLVATDQLGRIGHQALGMLRAYIWPGLNYPTVDEVHRLVDRKSSLRVIGQTHFASHYLTCVKLQREVFEGQLREAAADGFDAVFRRMWIFHFAVIEALLRLGCLDAVQFTLTSRNRRGRR